MMELERILNKVQSLFIGVLIKTYFFLFET